ncbi:hypothetical protein BDM02DRAFT_3187144 [Thelephora ganbajun]|uniref:Uncharacterized protein n=1 Tax=Thelephora ganbajun TaxID=370292 RepID=A0ACB6ZGC9_THEGA|nr:hypothetical protein BDM02DRAFT_3187144 [Thelephora ganbajun]
MSSFKSNVARGAAAPMGSDLTLMDLLTIGLVDWEGANFESERPLDSMRFAATVTEQLLSRLEVVEGQVASHVNALQLQALGLDSSINSWVDDHWVLLSKNAALECEVEMLRQTVERLDGEFGVLLAWVKALEWTAPSEYLSVEDLLRLGEGTVAEMEEDVAIEVESLETPIVMPVENVAPIPVRPPAPCRVVESSTTLRVIGEEEAREIEDHIVGAWQRQGADNDTPTIRVGLESSKSSAPSCVVPTVGLIQGQSLILSLEVRGYRMLSVMRAMTMMLNATVSACLLSSDNVGGELQLVFLISQEEFDSLLSGELEAERFTQ